VAVPEKWWHPTDVARFNTHQVRWQSPCRHEPHRVSAGAAPAAVSEHCTKAPMFPHR